MLEGTPGGKWLNEQYILSRAPAAHLGEHSVLPDEAFLLIFIRLS
jgi:hypothetical protein